MNEPPSSAPAIGSVLADKYRVDAIVGAGGMGIVLAATHLHLQEQVAIKLLHPMTAARPGAPERFLREARVAMKLRGEHAVRVLDVGMLPDGSPFIAMEFLQGSDFSTVLREQKKATNPAPPRCRATSEGEGLYARRGGLRSNVGTAEIDPCLDAHRSHPGYRPTRYQGESHRKLDQGQKRAEGRGN